MNDQPRPWQQFLGALVAIVVMLFVLAVLGVGSWIVANWIVRTLVALLSGMATVSAIVNFAWLSDLYSTVDPHDKLRHLSPDKVAAVGAAFTAIFTLLLVGVTKEMGRASRRQAAGDAPLLRLDLDMAHTATAVTPEAPIDASYSADLQASDAKRFGEVGLATTSSRLVALQIKNVQIQPFAIARDIVVTRYVVLSCTKPRSRS